MGGTALLARKPSMGGALELGGSRVRSQRCRAGLVRGRTTTTRPQRRLDSTRAPILREQLSCLDTGQRSAIVSSLAELTWPRA